MNPGSNNTADGGVSLSNITRREYRWNRYGGETLTGVHI
jgi:hypothetical protein